MKNSTHSFYTFNSGRRPDTDIRFAGQFRCVDNYMILLLFGGWWGNAFMNPVCIMLGLGLQEKRRQLPHLKFQQIITHKSF